MTDAEQAEEAVRIITDLAETVKRMMGIIEEMTDRIETLERRQEMLIIANRQATQLFMEKYPLGSKATT